MNNAIKDYLDGVFARIPQSKDSEELKEEMLLNMNEKYKDLIKDGMSENEAINTVIEGIGDTKEIEQYLKAENNITRVEGENLYRFNYNDFNNIDISLFSLNLNVTAYDGDEIIIELLSKTSNTPHSKITVEKLGKSLIIKEEKRLMMLIPFYTFSEYLEVKLPVKYQEDFKLKQFSGNTDFDGSFAFKKFNLYVTSGNLKAGCFESGLYDIDIKSGNIKMVSLNGTGKLDITSGSLRIDNVTGMMQTYISSGNLHLGEFNGSGSFKLTSGGIKLDEVKLNGDLDLKATSGTIKINKVRDAEFIFKGSCSSGTIKTNFDYMYDKSKKNTLGKVGANPVNVLSADVVSGSIKINV